LCDSQNLVEDASELRGGDFTPAHISFAMTMTYMVSCRIIRSTHWVAFIWSSHVKSLNMGSYWGLWASICAHCLLQLKNKRQTAVIYH